MNKLLRILLLSMLVSVCSNTVSYAQKGFFGQIKADIHGDWGIDLGVSLTERFGLRAGMMTDMDRISLDNGKNIQAFNKAIGNNYRLSYSIGPMLKMTDWLWISATAGYGEIGTYAYNSLSDAYGISGKIKGLEAGFQLQFRLSSFSLEIGYGTLTNSFTLGRPYHDITFGIGVYM